MILERLIDMVIIEMLQGVTKEGGIVTYVSKDYNFRRYSSIVPFSPCGDTLVERHTARFTIKYTPAKAGGMSRNQVVELHRTSEDIQEGIKSKKKFDYDTTRPATPLKTIGKSQIKSWNKRLKRGL